MTDAEIVKQVRYWLDRGKETEMETRWLKRVCWLAEQSLRGGRTVQDMLPSGWIAVPVKATINMHNAAALSGLYEVPSLKLDDDGTVRLYSSAPDWSLVWLKMVEAAPSVSNAALGSGPTSKET